MLYQKGEKLTELCQTLNDIPKISNLKVSQFTMSEHELKKFKANIEYIFNDLNTALFNTLLCGTPGECKERIEIACNNVIDVLKNNYTQDLVKSFYKEKQLYYDFIFFSLIDDLEHHYPEHKNTLSTISNAYTDLRNEEKIFDFPEIDILLEDHFYIKRDLIHNVSYDTTKTYLTHCLELIYEKISNIVKEECAKEYKNPDVLPNILRKLTYYLEDKLSLNLKSKE